MSQPPKPGPAVGPGRTIRCPTCSAAAGHDVYKPQSEFRPSDLKALWRAMENGLRTLHGTRCRQCRTVSEALKPCRNTQGSAAHGR
jgi:hypothetical protein